MSSATCCRTASVAYRMPTHHSRFRPRSNTPAAVWRNRRSNHTAVNTANAACNDGQALPATSADFRKATEACRAQSISNSGTLLGHSQKIASPTRLSSSADSA